MEPEWIDKLEVVRRQLCEAVRMFFQNRDRVAIHTIVASAHQILIDIGPEKGVGSVIKDSKRLTPEAIQKLNWPYNFLKHADRDPDGKINVAPLDRFMSDFLLDAILMLQGLTGSLPIEAKIYWTWFVSKYPDEFPNDGELGKMKNQNLASLDFSTIIQFIEFSEIAGEISSQGISKGK